MGYFDVFEDQAKEKETLENNDKSVSVSVSKLLNIEASKNFLKDRFKPDFLAMKERAKSIQVIDDATEQQATDMAKQVKVLVKDLEKKQKSITDAPFQFYKAILAFRKTFTDPLQKIDTEIRNKLSNYQGKKELERRKREKAAQDALTKESEKLKADALLAGVDDSSFPPLVLPVEKKEVVRTESGASSHVRMDWKFIEIVDFSLVPEEYKTLDEKLVNARIKAGIHNIPGLKIEEVATSVVR